MKRKTGSNWITGIKGIADYFSFGLTKTSELVNAGRLPGLRKLDGKYLIRRVDLDAYVLHQRPFRKCTKSQKADILEGQA